MHPWLLCVERSKVSLFRLSLKNCFFPTKIVSITYNCWCLPSKKTVVPSWTRGSLDKMAYSEETPGKRRNLGFLGLAALFLIFKVFSVTLGDAKGQRDPCEQPCFPYWFEFMGMISVSTVKLKRKKEKMFEIWITLMNRICLMPKYFFCCWLCLDLISVPQPWLHDGNE